MAYLHPTIHSPDPTLEGAAQPCGDLEQALELYPYRLLRHAPVSASAVGWGARLNLLDDPGALELAPDDNGRAELLLDFGTELHAWLEIVVRAPERCHVLAVFGEHVLEAEGLIPCTEPRPELLRPIPAGPATSVRFDELLAVALRNRQPSLRGFRYVRLVFLDLRAPITLRRVCAHARFTFTERRGAFQCSDARLQRAWQTSLYTARLCARPDAIWDGIKRDRSGWYGDARVNQLALDAVYGDPAPADAMLPLVPTAQWVNGVPGFSFDAIAMLWQRIFAYGADAACVRDCYERIRAFLAWVQETQTNADGFIVRADGLAFFADIGFLDWSLMPVGGRFEELSWLQCKYAEGLRHAIRIARWLDRPDDAAAWETRVHDLQREIVRRFWDAGRGFIHTLNHVADVPNPLKHGASLHYQRTYVDGVRCGPSGPSRHANILAVLAGLCTPAMRETILRRVLDNPAVEPIITAYFRYYENSARAQCGDAAGALTDMADYLIDMIEREDAATIWEVYDPRVRDHSRYYGGFDVTWEWEISFCHGWGSGFVPLVQQYLLGIEPAAPGFAAVRLHPAQPSPWPIAFRAALPTPYGSIDVLREEADGTTRVRLPREIRLEDAVPDAVVVERR